MKKEEKGELKLNWDLWCDALDYMSLKLNEQFLGKVKYPKHWKKEMKWRQSALDLKLSNEEVWAKFNETNELNFNMSQSEIAANE